MAQNSGFGARLRTAKRRFEEARDPEPVSDREIGELVGKALGREAYSSQAVNRWLKGRVPDDLAVIEAIAQVLGVTPEWLAFGVEYSPGGDRYVAGDAARKPA